MKNLKRSTRLAVVPAVFAALALSACQDEAPSAAPPTPASPTAEQSGAGGDAQPSEGGESQPTETATAAPETSDAPSSDSGGGGGSSSTGCSDSSSFSFKKGSVEAKEQSATQTATYKSSGGQADVSFGKPSIDTSAGNTFFPGEGMKTVIYPVTIEMKSGSFFITSRLQINLTDANDGSCRDDSGGYVVNRNDILSVESLRDPGQKITKKVAFAVPADADLSKFHLLYSTDYSSGNAELAWKAE